MTDTSKVRQVSKLSLYQRTILFQLAIALLIIIVVIGILKQPISALGFAGPTSWIPLILYIVGLGLVTAILYFSSPSSMLGKFRRLELSRVQALRPMNRLETRWLIGLAIIAGFCEELLFRGLGVLVLTHLGLTELSAIFILAIVFGFVHRYQGSYRMILTGFSGLILGILYITTDSIYAPIMAHIIADLQLLVFKNFDVSPYNE